MAVHDFDFEKTALAPDDLRRLWQSLQTLRHHPRVIRGENQGRFLAQNLLESLQGGKSFNEASIQVGKAADRFQKALDEANIRELSRQANKTLKAIRNAGVGAALAIGAVGGYRQLKRLQRESRQKEYWEKAIQELEKTSSLDRDLLQDPNIQMHLFFRSFLKQRKKNKTGAHHESGGSNMNKQAALTPEQKKRALEVLKNVLRFSGQVAAPVIGGAILAEVSSGASGLTKQILKRPDKAWQKFVNRFPEYRGDRKAREYFDVLYDFNPAAARHPVVVRAYLEGLYQYEFFNPQLLETMTKVEGGYRRAKDQDNLFRDTATEALKKMVQVGMTEVDAIQNEAYQQALQDLTRRQRHLTPAERRMLRNKLLKSEVDLEERLVRFAGGEMTPKEKVETVKDALRQANILSGFIEDAQEELDKREKSQ